MLSIVIPTKNEERCLARTLEALRSCPDCELIVSDGRSTDATPTIARQYADQVVVPLDDRRQTIGAGRNLGARSARGDLLVFIDADLQIPDAESFFARACAYFDADPQLVAVSAALRVLPEHATWMDKLVHGIATYVFVLFNNVLRIGAAQGEFQMIRAAAFHSVGGYREDLVAAEDHDMFYRLSKLGRTRMQPDLVVYHSGRRAHHIGWPKLLWQWTVACTSYVLFNRSAHREWEVIR